MLAAVLDVKSACACAALSPQIVARCHKKLACALARSAPALAAAGTSHAALETQGQSVSKHLLCAALLNRIEGDCTMTTQRTCGLAALLLATIALTSGGCGEAERIYDCARICDGYADCIDDSVDRVDCVDRCEDKGQEDADFAAQANDCEMCIDDESCTDATVECATKCAWVVAEST